MPQIFYKDNSNRKHLIEILFEDDKIIALNKSAFLPVIPDRFGSYDLKSLVADYLKQKEENPFVVHRIDADTSGVVLFAKDKETHRELNMLFENRRVHKKYWAIVNGFPKSDSGNINLALSNAGRGSAKMIIDPAGKPSETNYKVLESFGRYSLLEVEPLTGRMHQVRVHLKALGTPLAIDPLYGSAKPINLAMIKSGYRFKKDEIPNNLCERLTLHARSVSFIHPGTKQELYIEAELPKDLKALLTVLGKWDVVDSRKKHELLPG